MEALPPQLGDLEVDLPAISALLSAGMQHLLLRSRTVTLFNGVPIASEEGWRRIEAALQTLCQALLKPEAPR